MIANGKKVTLEVVIPEYERYLKGERGNNKKHY
jgi:hypothetical protein